VLPYVEDGQSIFPGLCPVLLGYTLKNWPGDGTDLAQISETLFDAALASLQFVIDGQVGPYDHRAGVPTVGPSLNDDATLNVTRQNLGYCLCRLVLNSDTDFKPFCF
jgi:hypothetical protein